jgi:hypothetical protein
VPVQPLLLPGKAIRVQRLSSLITDQTS